MFDPEPGPFALTDREPPGPPPGRASFVGIVADALGDLPGLDTAFGNARNDLADAASQPDDGMEGELAGAVDDGLLAPGADVPGTLADALSQGENVEALRGSVADTLPPPDTPLSMDFDDPPSPPVLTAAPDVYPGSDASAGNVPEDQ